MPKFTEQRTVEKLMPQYNVLNLNIHFRHYFVKEWSFNIVQNG